MRTLLALTALTITSLALAAPASAGYPPLSSEPFEIDSGARPASFYCQDPEMTGVYNTSSGLDSEIADDIPDGLVGWTIEEVTLWVGEYYGSWQDPTGVKGSFYAGACPPAFDAFISFTIPWNQWDATLVYNGIATVYMATATLPEPVTIEAGMSIGGQVVIPWGHDEPFAGLCSTPEWVIAGCGEAYLDATWWGYARWSPTSLYTQIPRDFAYCLSGEQTSVGEGDHAGDIATTWASPNPFRLSTSIHYVLNLPGDVAVRIYDAAGRLIATLDHGPRAAGDHVLTWDGRDNGGEPVSTGVYFCSLSTEKDTRTLKLVLSR